MVRGTFIFILLSAFSFAQKNNVFTNTADKAKIELAKQKIYAGQFMGAINSLKEVAKTSPNDANVFYYMGYSYFMLNQTDNAKEQLNKAIQLAPNKASTHFILGRIYQNEEKYEDAISEFNLFTANSKPEDEDSQDATIFISQCNVAPHRLGILLDKGCASSRLPVVMDRPPTTTPSLSTPSDR